MLGHIAVVPLTSFLPPSLPPLSLSLSLDVQSWLESGSPGVGGLLQLGHEKWALYLCLIGQILLLHHIPGA